MPDLIRIDMACNDPDNGLFAGRVAMIHLPDQLLELTANEWNILSFRGCPRLREEPGAIILSGKRWPIVRAKEWYGNWCWNAYWMQPQAAKQFLVWLHGRGLFHCETGETWACELWDLADVFNPDATFGDCPVSWWERWLPALLGKVGANA
jgi:hypothetical protein